MPKKSSISAVVIAKDEEQLIEGCLKSLSFCDEVVVIIDARTTDKTEKIAQRYTNKVFNRKFDTFSNQKNYGFKKVTSEWILSIDADERISHDLRTDILNAIEQDHYWGFSIPTKPYIFGFQVKHGGWWQSEEHLRLFRSDGRHSGDVHETMETKGQVGHLHNGVVHFNFYDLRHFVTKLNNYTDLEASQLEAGSVKFRRRMILVKPIREFIFSYVKKSGYKDGFIGLVLALLMAFYRLVAYLKLWERQRGVDVRQRYKEIDEELLADEK